MAAVLFQEGMVLNPAQITPTPTIDRLAQPTLPARPSQADEGAQVYWLSCLPCHGDKGQGLTDEFRTTYPLEEQYCWERGCHGEVPYENGFKIPKAIPGVIGDDTLAKFTDAAQLNSYIRAAMPFWKPGSLTQEQAWQVTAFILRENGIWNGMAALNETNANTVKILRGSPIPTSTPEQNERPIGLITSYWTYGLGILVVVFALLFISIRSRQPGQNP